MCSGPFKTTGSLLGIFVLFGSHWFSFLLGWYEKKLVGSKIGMICSKLRIRMQLQIRTEYLREKHISEINRSQYKKLRKMPFIPSING